MTSSTATPVVDSGLRRIGRLLGWLSLFATLALLSPGVVLTASAQEHASGPACPAAQEGDEHSVAGLEQMIERLRAQAAQDGAAGGVVSLNTRGFNYATPLAPPPPPEPEGR